MITLDEIIEVDAEAISYDGEKKQTIPTIFFLKKQPLKYKIFMFYTFYISIFPYFLYLLIAVALLIAVSIYCYLIQCQAKQKHLLVFLVTNNVLII